MALPVPWSGDTVFANVERANVELFSLKYGAMVRQLLTELEEVKEVNKQLDQIGYNIGIRSIDEFLAKSNISRCDDFKETADVIAKVVRKPGTVKTYKKFEAEIYVLTKDEGGRHTAFFSNYRPQFYMRTADVTGKVELPENVKMLMPGQRFALREGWRTVGAGVVSKVIS